MIIRRRKSDDYIGPSTGVMKWVNKFIRFVLFPFIHPLFFVILLAVLGGAIVGIHYVGNVAYKDIPSWVVTQSKSVWSVVSKKIDMGFISSIGEKFNKVSSKVEDVSEVLETATGAGVAEKKPVKETVRAIDRKAFRKAQDIPIDVKATVEGKTVRAVEGDFDSLFNYKKDYTLGLTYKNEARVVKGSVSVVNVNEIKINGENMFLYGIYAKPSSPRGVDGALYLQSLVDGKEVECRIVAFTQNAELTAMCVVDGVSINHKLVDMGFSQNVCLR